MGSAQSFLVRLIVGGDGWSLLGGGLDRILAAIVVAWVAYFLAIRRVGDSGVRFFAVCVVAAAAMGYDTPLVLIWFAASLYVAITLLSVLRTSHTSARSRRQRPGLNAAV